MSRLPGHEDCWTCPTCGLSDCPDCDSNGRSCMGVHPGDRVIQLDLAAMKRYRDEQPWRHGGEIAQAWLERNGTWVTEP